MDPPTAYIFPSAFDRITVLKGPQSVQYGPDTSAGVVLLSVTSGDSTGSLRWTARSSWAASDATTR